MLPRRLHFIEPSKIGRYHITLIDGYLRALLMSSAMRRSDLFFYGSPSTWANLSEDARRGFCWKKILVLDGDKRRLILKSIVEFFAVLRLMLFTSRRDAIFVSCVLPTALLMIEIANSIIRRPNFYVTIHGEIEGAFEPSTQHVRSYGFWVVKWLKVRRRTSTLQVVLISSFAREGLLEAFPDRFDPATTHLVPHPIVPHSSTVSEGQRQTVCFIGYKTPFKGYGSFERASQTHPEIAFRVVGGGVVENIRTAESRPLVSSEAFLEAIADCSGAMFPYLTGYRLSLSAAALDALATGTHLIATARPCFLSLQSTFGTDAVTVYRSDAELDALLSKPGWLAERTAGRRRRLEAIEQSEYGLLAVSAAFVRLLSSPGQGSVSQ